MTDLVLHDQTIKHLEQLAAQPVQGILLTGEDGVGKGAVAFALASKLLETDAARSPQCKHVEPDEKGTISIEKVRELQRFLRLKTTGKARIRRAIIIEHSSGMTTEAQNAFLKTLEEPPADTVLILTVAHPHDVLPTILSRLQQFAVMAPPADTVQRYFGAMHPATAVTQAYFLSGGLPGLMSALLSDEQDHPLKQSVQQAKELLQADAFARATRIDQFKQKTDAVHLCQALQRIAQTSLMQAAGKQDDKRLSQWHKILRASTQAQELLHKNANTKLVLTHLVLQLS